MPMFDYKCIDCKHEFDELVMKKDQEIICPNCKSKNCKRFLIPKSAPGFQLKGSGWTGKFHTLPDGGKYSE